MPHGLMLAILMLSIPPLSVSPLVSFALSLLVENMPWQLVALWLVSVVDSDMLVAAEFLGCWALAVILVGCGR